MNEDKFDCGTKILSNEQNARNKFLKIDVEQNMKNKKRILEVLLEKVGDK